MVCAKCNVEFTNNKEVAKCSECGSEFHAACCRIRTAAKLAGMSARAAATWRCDECAQETASATSRSDTDDPTVLELLRNISREMADSKRANRDSFASLEKSLSSVHASLSEVKEKLSAVEAEHSELKQQCGSLRAENATLAQRVKELQHDMVDLQQYTRCTNLEIRGVPATQGEDIYAVTAAVAKALNVPFERQDISIAHRLPAPRDRRYHPSIVAQFVSRSSRATWITAARGRRLQTTDLAPSLPPGPVFVCDHLTPYNKDLLRRAKSVVRQGGLAYAWSKDGKILVRATADSPARRVWTVDDVMCVAVPRRQQPGAEVDTDVPHN